MLISNYFVFQNYYVVPNFNDGMLCYFTISASSRYVLMIGFTDKNKDDDGVGGDT
jgi:hypothetical protein